MSNGKNSFGLIGLDRRGPIAAMLPGMGAGVGAHHPSCAHISAGVAAVARVDLDELARRAYHLSP